ncbi:melanophilin isoform X1 [Pelobates cultripes]|uniref:Melanophilin isoform X1 n=1 Tax=Pelobates cultripes TaxID=61616 RepID=A0AAD1WD42_PELCU|nr:melanophilin isoform X1 [Pelobates cultripes]
MGKKLDLTKLSDDEAKHVWEVVQRDISLRRKEEERLEDLKFKVEKESAKREILSGQSRLNNTHCLHCLNPFQFLLNSKRQCQDCKFYVCKNCSRYNKKEQGWVCDTCRATRMVKIGSLEWYYDHVRSRFKRFGSAKVMRHLYTRLQPDARGGTNLTGLSDRVYSLPDISREYLRQARSGMFHDDDEDIVDSAEAQRYSMMRKTKRLLSVHPFDFEIDSEYSAQSRRQSMQLSPTLEQDVFQSFSEYTSTGKDAPQKDSLIAEAELASMFHHLLQEQDQNMAPPEQEFSTEVRLTVNRRRSLENTRRPNLPSLTESLPSCPYPDPKLTRTRYLPKGSPSLLPKGSQYSGDMDSSDEERGAIHKVPPRRRSRASSQENVHHSGTQISELNKRMSTIERMLNRLEERISVASDESTGPGFHTDADIEEETLKRKLGELASNISDKGGSSDDEKILKSKQMSRSYNVRNPDPSQKRIAAQALCDITAKTLRTINATERAMQEALGDESQHVAITSTKMRGSKKAQSEFQNLEENVYMAAEKAYGLENNLKDLEERACQSTTDSELSEIEVSVASAMAQVQQAESEVSDIESRIAALSAAGLTVSPSEKAKRKSSPQTSVTAISRSTEPFMPSSPELYNLNSTPSEAKILSMQDALRKKFNIDSQLSDGVFERNALYRGSLTQRNPNGKNKKVDRMFAKPPILTQR